MDIADQASAIQEQTLAIALSNSKLQQRIAKTGFCNWCHEETTGSFCSKECADDKGKRDRMRL